MNEQHDEMIEKSYDFSRGVRGKHHRAMRQGYQVTIHQDDGSTRVREYVMPPNTVVLEDDVFAQFPSSAAVNLFGSRLDDRARGGDIDLLVNP